MGGLMSQRTVTAGTRGLKSFHSPPGPWRVLVVEKDQRAMETLQADLSFYTAIRSRGPHRFGRASGV